MISSAAAIIVLGMFITPICAYDSAAVPYGTSLSDFEPPEEISVRELTELEGERAELLSNETMLDFSFLNGEFTVEVSGASDDSSLLIADCAEDDALLDVHIINDVQPENTVHINGSYARAFLWELDDMSPQCESITTKTDYPIIEGVEGDWEVSEDGHTIYSYLGDDTEVVIPNSYMGKRIYTVYNEPAMNALEESVALADLYKFNIFGGRTDIISVTLPEGITGISHCAFAGCENIASVIPVTDDITLIGNYAFYGCSKMTGGLDLSNIELMGTNGTFMNCSSLDGELILPDKSTIGSCMFYGCSSLRGELAFSERTASIGPYAFENCTSLTGSVDLSGINELGARAFYGCYGLNGTLTLPSIKTIPYAAFAYCENLTGELNIPEGVEIIEDFAFSEDDSPAAGYTSLTLPGTLKDIGVCVFQYQTKMRNELIFPEGLEHIGDFAFNHCSGFSNTTVTLPSSLRMIGGDYNVDENTGCGCHVFYNAFMSADAFVADGEYFKSVDGVLYSSDMTRLVAYPPAKTDAEFTVPDGVTHIDEMSLGYSKFTDLYLPDSYILNETVPANVLNSQANNLAVALYHYNAIKNVFVSETSQYFTSVDGIVYSKDMKELWYVPTKKTGTIIVPDGVETIRKGAFYIEHGVNGETYTGVYIPASVTYIAPEPLTSINLRPLADITVDPANEYYTVTDGKLVQKGV